ncbi:MAG: hypothetical protein GY911_10660 [Actinomycetales bacterium]|nr:hypothetical protein [Actinomycetales bacterium]
MNRRPMIGMSKKVLCDMIRNGDPTAVEEGIERNKSRQAKGKKPLAGYVGTAHESVLTTIANDSDAMSGHDVHVRTLADANYNDLADRQDALDLELWGVCLAKCKETHSSGARWAAYHLMEEMGIPRKRIATASGCKNVASVTQGISKHRRGVAPDMSFVGK